MNIKASVKHLWSKRPYRMIAAATISLAILAAIPLILFSGGWLIPGIVLGLIVGLGIVGAVIRHNPLLLGAKGFKTILNSLDFEEQITFLNTEERLGDTSIKATSEVMRIKAIPEVIRNILNSKELSPDQKIKLLDLRNGKGLPILMKIPDNVTSIRDLLNSTFSTEQKMYLLGYGALLRESANLNAIAVIQEILNTQAFTSEQKMILLCRPLKLAAECNRRDLIRIILNTTALSSAQKIGMLLYKEREGANLYQVNGLLSAIYEKGLESVHEILNAECFSIDEKMSLLTTRTWLPEKMPFEIAVTHSTPQIVRTILDSITPEKRQLLFAYHDANTNKNIYLIQTALDKGRHDMVKLLEEYGATLPPTEPKQTQESNKALLPSVSTAEPPSVSSQEKRKESENPDSSSTEPNKPSTKKST